MTRSGLRSLYVPIVILSRGLGERKPTFFYLSCARNSFLWLRPYHVSIRVAVQKAICHGNVRSFFKTAYK